MGAMKELYMESLEALVADAPDGYPDGPPDDDFDIGAFESLVEPDEDIIAAALDGLDIPIIEVEDLERLLDQLVH